MDLRLIWHEWNKVKQKYETKITIACEVLAAALYLLQKYFYRKCRVFKMWQFSYIEMCFQMQLYISSCSHQLLSQYFIVTFDIMLLFKVVF